MVVYYKKKTSIFKKAIDKFKSWTGGKVEYDSEIYTAVITLTPGAQTLEWEVKLVGVPTSGDEGKEVVAYWQVIDFSNDKTFYTDSNGLEMQKRTLNKRTGWTLDTIEKASSNYYPINSAIAIKSAYSFNQVTVMNDRSQGGSVLQNGGIEIMQNRRLLVDDIRGVEEPLNEVDLNGQGMQVNVKYHL